MQIGMLCWCGPNSMERMALGMLGSYLLVDHFIEGKMSKLPMVMMYESFVMLPSDGS